MPHRLLPSWRSLLATLAVLILASPAACGGGGDDNDVVTDPTADAPVHPVFRTDMARHVVRTADGPVRAVFRKGMASYFGLPYAAPPTGSLRWTSPQAPAKWTRPLAKTQAERPCLQSSASPFRLPGDSEDCLYVDVHAPAGHGPYPVMVWFYGGAFHTGGTVTYDDPSPLVSKGVIVVNVAYRLGPMGFLGHPVLRAGAGGTAPAGSVGNYGIQDQQAALRWVRNNIRGFGGDRNNVTIFGESAGGISVMTHLASRLSQGLFHKAIVQSGMYALDRGTTQASLETASTTVVADTLDAAAAANVTLPCTKAHVTADCLRSLPESVLRTQLAVAFTAAYATPGPSIDGHVLTQSIKATFIAGENSKVPFLHGSTQDEYALFLVISERARRAAATPPNFDPADTSFVLPPAAYGATLAALSAGTGVSAESLVTTHYPLTNYGGDTALQPSLGVTALSTDVNFACLGLAVSKRILAQASPVWMYEFRDKTAIPSTGVDPVTLAPLVSTPFGAAHTHELQYLFNIRDPRNEERRALQDTMSRYWTNFARTGNPNTGRTVPASWPAYGGDPRNDILGLDVASGGGVRTLDVSFDAAHKCSSVWPMKTF